MVDRDSGDAGVFGLKMHLNAYHRATDITFGSFEQELPFIEKLATYTLRRTMSFDDRDQLKAIAAAGKAADYRVKDILTALVTSDLFQKR